MSPDSSDGERRNADFEKKAFRATKSLSKLEKISLSFESIFSLHPFCSLYLDDDHVDSPVAPPPVVTHSLSKTYAATVQEDSIPDIDDVLKKLNLTDYSSKFHDEKVDTETLVRRDGFFHGIIFILVKNILLQSCSVNRIH